jgi:hypothetical protein
MTLTSANLQFLRESIPQFEPYLLSEELFWPMGSSLPRLTPGAFLIDMKRVAYFMPAEAKLFDEQFNIVKSKWHSAWNRKISRERKNRLRLWSGFLSDSQNSSEKSFGNYSNEVRGRVILEILLEEIGEFPEQSVLDDLDKVVKSNLKPGGFLWDADEQSVFPMEPFWYLYGKI